jgi:hypothetical protein
VLSPVVGVVGGVEGWLVPLVVVVGSARGWNVGIGLLRWVRRASTPGFWYARVLLVCQGSGGRVRRGCRGGSWHTVGS